MIEHGVSLMVIGMGTVGAFLTTMVGTMSLSATVAKKWFPEKKKSASKKATPKKKSATAEKKAATAKSTTKKSGVIA